MSNLKQSKEELDAVLLWRGKHAVAIKERDALQQRLTAADERADSLESGLKWESDRNALLLASLTEAEDMLSITSLEAGRRIDQLEGLLFSLPEDLKALSGCENKAGVYACIDYIEQCIAGLQRVTAKQPLY